MINLDSFPVKIKHMLKAILKDCKISKPFKPQKNEIEAVLYFFCNYSDFRSLAACAKKTGLDINLCARIKNELYEKRELGLYHFEAGVPPQKYMRQYILKKFSHIDIHSHILEVGPGEYPLFSIKEYPNWYGVDKYLENGEINFKELNWAKDKYPAERMFKSGWENISESFIKSSLFGNFDLIAASHSYEHCFKPIQALKEACKMLRKGGILVLFVPDGFTDDPSTKDPTHTIYVVPGMMEEFFHHAGGFKDILIESFRPNADLVITAIKE